METKMLQLALSTPNPEITTEMQDHIRAILVEREKATSTPPAEPQNANPETEKETTHA
jgi:hypothetical protein